jgi:ABC-type lipopolysaccharide export system ATPase subunit
VQTLDLCRQFDVIFLVKLLFGVAFEIGVLGNWQVWRIEKHKIARAGVFLKHTFVIATLNDGAAQQIGRGFERPRVENLRVLITAKGYVELPAPVDSIQPIETGVV